MASKQIILKHEDKDYILEYNRKSIEIMERQGFIASELSNKPMTQFPALFAGAFLMHHRGIDKRKVDDMMYKIKNKEEFLDKLSEMYSDPIVTLLDEPEEDEGNIDWDATW